MSVPSPESLVFLIDENFHVHPSWFVHPYVHFVRSEQRSETVHIGQSKTWFSLNKCSSSFALSHKNCDSSIPVSNQKIFTLSHFLFPQFCI